MTLDRLHLFECFCSEFIWMFRYYFERTLPWIWRTNLRPTFLIFVARGSAYRCINPRKYDRPAGTINLKGCPFARNAKMIYAHVRRESDASTRIARSLSRSRSASRRYEIIRDISISRVNHHSIRKPNDKWFALYPHFPDYGIWFSTKLRAEWKWRRRL